MLDNHPIKILITGGHLTPAQATITALLPSRADILFIGREHTGSLDSPAHEKTEVTGSNIKFIPLDAPKFHRKPLSANLTELIKIHSTLRRLDRLVFEFQPHIFLSFGGYLALWTALTARKYRVPILTHEQTLCLGLANRVIAPFAHRVALSWPQTQKSPAPDQDLHSNHKYVLTGNPVRQEFVTNLPKPSFLTRSRLPLLFITGGSQGARDINQYVLANLPSLTQKYRVVHQTGSKRALTPLTPQDTAKRLTPESKANYFYRSWFSAPEMASLLQHSDLVISRAGANTITELLVTQARSITIPLPTSAAGEQLLNARMLESLGLSSLLPESNLDQLPTLIHTLLSHPAHFRKAKIAQLRNLHSQAAVNLATLTLQCAQKSTVESI